MKRKQPDISIEDLSWYLSWKKRLSYIQAIDRRYYEIPGYHKRVESSKLFEYWLNNEAK